MAIYGFSQLYQMAVNAGFSPGQQANTAAAIALAESGGNSNNVNTNYRSDPGGSYGLMQINAASWPQFMTPGIYDPQTNMNNAYSVYQAQGFSAWSTYKNGAYSAYMPGGSHFAAGVDNSNVTPDVPASDSGSSASSGGMTYTWPGTGTGTTSGSGSTASSGSGATSGSGNAAASGTAGGLQGIISGILGMATGGASAGVAQPVASGGTSVPAQLRADTISQNQQGAIEEKGWLASLGDWFQRGGIMIFAVLVAMAAILWLGLEHRNQIKRVIE